MNWYQRPEARKPAAPKYHPPTMAVPGVLLIHEKDERPWQFMTMRVTGQRLLTMMGRFETVQPRAIKEAKRLVWLSEHGRPAQRKRAAELMA